jgi:hypothetical protein
LAPVTRVNRGICFVKHIPRFTRFEARAFLDAAFTFMDGTCPRCVIDNTSVIVAYGTGADAVMSPEMHAFAKAYDVHSDAAGGREEHFLTSQRCRGLGNWIGFGHSRTGQWV